MKGRLKNIISLSLLLIFIFPASVKLVHHHELFVCKAKGEQHLHVFHKKCNICSFEFSVFSSADNVIHIASNQLVIHYYNNYKSSDHSILEKYSFLLRAPPYRQA